ncbi:hypothetical protein PBI_JACE_78 [Gordonia phage Jace]|uniref:Uncharacterized protein n=1 Tax=Gordonia phage Jace TaxID=2182360 RepID=A0A2U8UJD0_9CAUD|nr:hypothetical protein HOT28_gp78 [Gordonia phage Jace]AWN03698.1 hypothetical protein PBI_JACE_78 [Gordonia phage Jace]
MTIIVAAVALALLVELSTDHGRRAARSAAYFLRTLPLRLRLRWMLARYMMRRRRERKADER